MFKKYKEWSIVKKITAICGLITALAGVVTLLFTIDHRFAKSSELKKVKTRLEHKIESDHYQWLEQRSYTLKDRYINKPMPQSVKEEIRKIEDDLKWLREKIKSLMKDD